MIVRMELLSDMIFGSGQSIPGEEDISILVDDMGCPYCKGGTFKGVFREEMERLLSWNQDEYDVDRKKDVLTQLLGESDGEVLGGRTLIFSDFTVSDEVRQAILAEKLDEQTTKDIFTSLRTFTKIADNGMVEDGTLRIARCVNSGINLYGEIECDPADATLVKEVIGLIKWMGTMRNRGFGKIRVTEVEEKR